MNQSSMGFVGLDVHATSTAIGFAAAGRAMLSSDVTAHGRYANARRGYSINSPAQAVRWRQWRLGAGARYRCMFLLRKESF